MPGAVELLRVGKTEELWQKCCGFVDLSTEQFMTIQRRLLLEQIELLKRCELGDKVMRGARPRSVEEFRKQVPLTTYADYAPFLPERIEEALPERPIFWQRTSGRSEEDAFKWVPVTRRMYYELDEVLLGVMILASCRGRGDVVLEENDKFLYAMAPPPYASGCWGRRAAEWGVFDFLPPVDEAEKMEFEARLTAGFGLAMSEGMDLLFALTGLLVMIGDQFGQGGGLKRVLPLLSKPKALVRVMKAVAKSKLARRPLLPRDVWGLKLLLGFGTDTAVFRERLKNMWGRYPLDVYGATETVVTATQTWDYGSMTFVPHINFLEFVPENEYRKWAADRNHKPRVLLLDEVEAGENYALVITNFLGGAYVRYLLGDIITITSLRNEELDIDIPQMEFYCRLDGVIDIEGWIIMPEGYIGHAVENSGLAYRDWVVRQEKDSKHRLHFYLELKNGVEIDTGEAAVAIGRQLRELNPFFGILEDRSDVEVEVTLLPTGAFGSYVAKQRAAGVDLGHFKPPHINPSDSILNFLLGSGSSN